MKKMLNENMKIWKDVEVKIANDNIQRKRTTKTLTIWILLCREISYIWLCRKCKLEQIYSMKFYEHFKISESNETNAYSEPNRACATRYNGHQLDSYSDGFASTQWLTVSVEG